MSNPVRQGQNQSPQVGDPGGSNGPIFPGWLISGYAVDNLSGSWLYNPATGQWIAPYTLGFTSALRPAVLSLLVQYAAVGPGGQASSTLGTPFSVTMYDSPILNNPGTAFLNPDGSPLTAISVITKLPLFVEIGSAISAVGVNTQTVTLATAPIAGDFLLCQVIANTTSGGTIWIAPSGWQQLPGSDSTFSSRGVIFYKIATGLEGTSFTFGSNRGVQQATVVAVYRGLVGYIGNYIATTVTNTSFASIAITPPAT